MDDAPVDIDGQPSWLIDQVGGRFQVLYFCDDPSTMPEAMQLQLQGLAQAAIPVEPLVIARRADKCALKVLVDREGIAFPRYDATPGTLYLIRPDQHVAARWREAEVSRIVAAVARATANFAEA
jgi:3-(3-hydroxy-phenyl)propionate hydroxylase